LGAADFVAGLSRNSEIMSLIVYPYLRNEQNGAMMDIKSSINPSFNDLFGVESWRYKVWGAAVLEALGCNLLSSLRKTDIYAEGKELEKLETELLHIKRELPNLIDKLKVNEKSVEFRIENALEAISIAKVYQNGGVYIG